MPEPGPRTQSEVALRPGTLVLVVGASGAGKDTLIDAARRYFAGDTRFVFPTRIITRADQTGEPHIAVNADAFAELARAGRLYLYWHAHDAAYGLPMSVADALADGKCVVANVSRGVIGAARARWHDVAVIEIVVEPAALRARLIARGRETAAEIEGRLARADAGRLADDEPRLVIDNSGPLADAAAAFIAQLSRYASG